MPMFALVSRGIVEQRHEISTQVALVKSKNSIRDAGLTCLGAWWPAGMRCPDCTIQREFSDGAQILRDGQEIQWIPKHKTSCHHRSGADAAVVAGGSGEIELWGARRSCDMLKLACLMSRSEIFVSGPT